MNWPTAERPRYRPDLTSSAGIYVSAAGGGVVLDVDGNSFIDLGSGIAVTTVGNAAPAVVSRAAAQLAQYTHTCFLATPYEPYIEVAEALNRIDPGQPREAHRALQHRQRGRWRTRSSTPGRPPVGRRSSCSTTRSTDAHC